MHLFTRESFFFFHSVWDAISCIHRINHDPTTQETYKMTIVYNKHGEPLKAVPLKSLAPQAQFLRKPDAKCCFYKGHYNRKSWHNPTPSYTCMPHNDVLGGGVCINAKAIVYVSPNNWRARTLARANDIVLCYLSGQPVKAASNKYSKKS
jgi:hypothetical protein